MSNTSVGVLSSLVLSPVIANAAWIVRHNVPALQRVGGVPFVLGSLAAGAAVSAGCFYKSWKIPEDVLDKIAAQEKAEKIAKAASIAATKKALVAQVRAEHNSA